MERKLVGVFLCMLLTTTTVFQVTAVGHSLSNNPPEIPHIMGPTNGTVGTAYDYMVNTVDPDGDNVSYWVEWGDGTHTGWTDSYPSGEHAVVNHTWYERGSFLVTAKAKDIYDAESDFSAPLMMNVTGPQIDITVRPRGFGAAATIINWGEDVATNVTWNVTLTGGIVLFGRSKGSTIDEILPGEMVPVSSFFFGFLRCNITATAGNSSDSLGGFLAGPFLLSVTKNEVYNGSVEKIDVEKKEVTVKNLNGALKTFKIDPSCKFKDKNGNGITIDQIKKGDSVKVTWQRQGSPNTEKVAVEIQKLE